MLKKRLAWLLFSLLVVPVHASAASISITTGSSTYVASGTPLNGTFDINAALGGLGLSAPLDIASGFMTFNFTDDVDAIDTTSVTTTTFQSQLCGSILGAITCTAVPHYLVGTVSTSTDPIERATVTSGGMTGSASSTNQLFDTFFQGETRKTHQACGTFGCTTIEDTYTVVGCGPFGCAPVTYPLYTSTTLVRDYWGGPFSLTLYLNAAALSDLGADGLLPFSIAASTGDFNFLSASLDVQLGDEPVSAVPEPSTLLLLGPGLAAAMRLRRRRPGPR